jgi:polar amino acid transport system substrate-binding protein
MRQFRALPAIAVLALLAACSTSGSSSPSDTAQSAAPSGSEVAAACQPDSLETKTAGRLTVATDNPAYSPYWEPPAEGDPTEGWDLGDPYSKRGFESAVAWAIAGELGFADDDVDFIAVPFDTSFAPGEKAFDFYLAQVSYTPERAQQVDMSEGYYYSNQALVANAGTPITDVTSMADLASYKLGAQVGTTAYQYITDVIQPDQEAAVYNSNDAAIEALNGGQIDGIVVDLPTAYFITAVQMDNGVVVGQFPPSEEQGQEYFSLVLEKDSPLTDCVNQAITSLRDSGQLDDITQEWMSENTDVPVLE